MSSVPKKNQKRKFALYVNGTAESGVETIHSDQSDGRFIDKDLSWIDFNARVLCQAADPTVPLLERLKFLAIASNNFDEFFMKRIGQLQARKLGVGGASGNESLSIKRHLINLKRRIQQLFEQQSMIYTETLLPELNKEGIELVNWDSMSPSELEYSKEYFRDKIFPLLTPLAVDAGHPFPFLSNLSTSIAFALKHPRSEEILFARVKLPEGVPNWIRLPNEQESKYRFISLKDLIERGTDELFPGMSLQSCMLFRITRSANIEIEEEDADDLLEMVESHLKERRSGQIIRLQHGKNPDPWILNFLIEELELQPDEIFEMNSEIDFKDFEPIYEINNPKLKYPRFTPTTPAALMEEGSIFHAIRSHDILVHHPYESFATSVERFVKEASEDPKVVSIKMTVYRVGQVTPLIPYLIDAAEQGKHVVCLVELKARFDEKQNIHWANTLEKSGVHVVYGIPGLKTHAKTLLVVRQDADGLRAYAHCGTGNYHARTANLYTDVGLFTAKKDMTSELVNFFNYLTGRSVYDSYKKLLVAPLQMEKTFLTLIEREIQNKQMGKPAHIIAKMNSLEDRHIIEELYKASQAGVQIDLIIRGLCCLKPGVKDMSENIRVISVVGRLLEHSRIFYFQNAAENPGQGEYYIGSADWMSRNMHRRIEVAMPVEDAGHKERLQQIFNVMLNDRKQSWQLNSDGTYTRLIPSEPPHQAHEVGSHETLMRLITDANTAS